MGSGKMAKERAKAVRYGRMAPFMKATGLTIWPTVKEDSFKQAAMSIKESGSTIKQRERVYISTRMALPIQENGITISSMAMVIRNGQMGLNMKGTMLKE